MVESININLTPQVAWFAFAVVLVFFVVMTAIYFHHWNYFGVTVKRRKFVKLMYLIVSGVFILISAFLALALSL